jgi:hypothetical protein
MKATWEPGQRFFFITVWVTATVFLGWQLFQRQYSVDSRISIVNFILLLLCTVTLLIQLPNPIEDQPQQKPTNTGLLFCLILLFAGILFLIPTRVIRILLFILPVVAILVLMLLKQPLGKRELWYGLGLALLAGVTGVGEGRIPWASPLLWSVLQLFLVFTSLLVGWSILQYTGLWQEGVGKSRFLSNGVIAACKAFVGGLLIATPWAFWNLVVARNYPDAWALHDGWLNAWWQPILALQPGIAEEAWARVFLVPLFFLIFRLVSQPRAAFAAALYVMAYWFTYLHTPGGLAAIQNTMMLGTLYGLPLSYLCLYRDLETAMGFHFWVDFLRFAFALMLFNK